MRSDDKPGAGTREDAARDLLERCWAELTVGTKLKREVAEWLDRRDDDERNTAVDGYEAVLLAAGQACVDWFNDHNGEFCHLCGPVDGKHDEDCPLEGLPPPPRTETPPTDAEALLDLDTPWPVPSMLDILANCVDHLLKAHGCDDHGHEEAAAARDAARQWLARYDARKRGDGK